ncbi:sugar transferase [Nostoc sp. 'Peltigera membranacea cyanobiont' 213]|uniref:heterocyst development glycosyltransferase HepC n=1 Tax=unclassified Nostoc TaxID=2593658 RepID=UPI000B953324|nr:MULTISPECIES: heterocyst development glycosyltransferase HepC [unclassified Nostoc]AVH66950.1 sugar transferase [Nostoc sp. 'Peltigera membranacea cyanobiont' N6]OYD95954.1 sugar transferase [Nostoc sp. 'Peltigera membranacea cyanobiont' 213]
MTASIIPTLENLYDVTQEHQDRRGYCTLQWRRGQLLVKQPGRVKQPYLPSLDSKRSLVECLQHSPVTLVSIDPKLGEVLLRFWADACEEADKPIFLSIPTGNKLPNQPWRQLQRLIDWIAAFVLLLLVSPVMLGLIVLMQIDSTGSLFCREWRVGERGKLFQSIKFCPHNITPLGRWMSKYSLDNLPQLFNVLRGDMSLTGSRGWTLEDAVQLNKLPEIKASWEVEAQSHLLHLDSQTL